MGRGGGVLLGPVVPTEVRASGDAGDTVSEGSEDSEGVAVLQDVCVWGSWPALLRVPASQCVDNVSMYV